MSLLPNDQSSAILREVRQNHTLCRKAVDIICDRHGLTSKNRVAFQGGSTIVYEVGTSHVVKLFSPCYVADCNREIKALEALQGVLKIPTPEPVASGRLDGWPYVVMTRLNGHLLSDVWDVVPLKNRTRLCRELGDILAQLHQIPTQAMDAFSLDWAQFITVQHQGCLARQEREGLAPFWLEQLPDYLKTLDFDRLKHPPGLSFLHTEVMRQHLYVRDTGAGWQYSGMFDFEPSMIGDPAYEFASVALFVSGGDGLLLQEVLAGYGLSLGANPSKTFMSYALLHRYSNFKWYLDIMPQPFPYKTWEDLERAWFTVGPLT